MNVMAKKIKKTKEETPVSKFTGMAIVDDRLVGLTWASETDKAISGLNVPRKWMKKKFVYAFDQMSLEEYNKLQDEIDANKRAQEDILSAVGQLFAAAPPAVKTKPVKEEKPKKEIKKPKNVEKPVMNERSKKAK